MKHTEPMVGPDQMVLLKDIAEALNGTYDISSAMAAILPRLSGVLGLQTAWAFRYDPKRGSYVEVGASGLPPALARDGAAALKSSWCECQERFVKGRLKTAVNIVRCSRLRDAVGEKHNLVFHASIPLRAKEKPLGILNVAAAGESVFTRSALDLLRAVGYQVAVAIDRSRMLSAAQHYSRQLQSLAGLAIDLATITDPERILTTAAERLVDTLAFDACGILRRSQGSLPDYEVVVKVVRRHNGQEEPMYSYLDPSQPSPSPHEQLLLPTAQSVIMQSVPHTEYWVRLESDTRAAFDQTDENIVTVFCGHIAAALENARLHAQSLQEVKWRERRQVAADLHDSVSQRLFSAQLLLRTLAVKRLDQPETNLVHQIQDLVHTSQEELRDMVNTLRPKDSRGFAKRIWDRLDPLRSELGLTVDCKIPLDVDQWLSLEQDDAVCNIVDEAMQNVLKHSQATKVSILVGRHQNRILVTISDNGVGFDLDGVTRGLGLYSMQDRIRALGGTLYIETAAGQGTTLRTVLPLSEG
ncbi:MAG: GAF domain-containing sensor histidine kinase [Firmicutes bacterium]|nr:GAF domain-containing sensor histidine kinase [Bacillota bacterium]